MASATGIPQDVSRDSEARGQASETEPLLGRPGDAIQPEDKPIQQNLVIGTGVLAQFGVWILVIWVWVAVLRRKVILFSGHPLAQTIGILALVQAILIVQPTQTGAQKRTGRIIHGSLNLVSFLSFVAGVSIIEYNKISSNGVHFHSVHGYLGVITSIILTIQYIVGFTMWLVPALYGGESNAKALYKYHRLSGYFILALLMATVISATKTDYNVNVLGLQIWGAVIITVLILAGVYPRLQLSKLGLKPKSESNQGRR